MNEETKENPPENISAVEVWKAITGLGKEVRFTNENVKVLQTNFSTVEAKIMKLTLNFKGLEDVNNDVENLKEEIKKKISTRIFGVILFVFTLLNGIIAYVQIVGARR